MAYGGEKTIITDILRYSKSLPSKNYNFPKNSAKYEIKDFLLKVLNGSNFRQNPTLFVI